MANSTNMLQLCRLCLVKDDVNIPIFEEQGDIRQIFLKISSCLPVKVSREDRLPKKICDGCSYKLDMLYEFWNTSANAEKQLLSWLGEAGVSSKMADGAISAMAQQMKPTEAFVKEETLEPADLHAAADEDEKEYLFEQQKVEESASAGPSATVTSNEEDEPPPKRARRTAAVKAAIAMDQDSDDDDDSGEPLTKVEDESEDSDGEDHVPAFVDVPSTSADDQPGPSGVGKDGVEAPHIPESSLIYKCQICDKCFESSQAFHSHMYIHSEKIYKCSVCGEIFALPCQLREHKKQMHLKVSSVKCEFCDSIYLDDIELNSHIETTHKDQRIPCGYCGCSFPRADSFKEHMIYYHLGAILMCDHCDRVFKHECDLRVHMKSLQPTAKRRIRKGHCRHCSTVFPNLSALNKHIASDHNGLSWICHVCGKTLSSKYSLQNHLRIHNGEKPYECDFCHKKFSRYQNFKSHRRIHTNEKPHVCDLCGKAFTQQCTLSIHKRTHTGERPYQCEICSRKFITKTVMKAHTCKI